MSKQLFELMRQQEIETSNFLPTKKELTKSTMIFIDDILEAGETNPVEMLCQAKRLQEAVNIIVERLRDAIPADGFEAFGVNAKFRNGGETVNYSDCEIWQQLSTDLKNREALLKLALKQDVIDAYGNEVVKVSTTPRKDALVITF